MPTLKTLIIPLLLISGCQTPEFYAFADPQNLPPIDTSALKKGRLENLDDLKGIDNWRLGMPKKYYKNAFYTDSAYQTDTCRADITNRSFYEYTKATLIFKDDTVSTIKLYIHSHNVRSLIRRLRDLYGEPNKTPFQYDVMSDSIVNFQANLPKEEWKQYMENPNNIFDSTISYDGPSLPLYRDNTMHMRDFRDTRWPDSSNFVPATSFDFFPNMKISASWKSTRSLDMKIFRQASIVPFPGKDTTLHVIHIDYYVLLEMR